MPNRTRKKIRRKTIGTKPIIRRMRKNKEKSPNRKRMKKKGAANQGIVRILLRKRTNQRIRKRAARKKRKKTPRRKKRKNERKKPGKRKTSRMKTTRKK